MPDFEKLYHLLFNAATDAFRDMDADDIPHARRRLIRAQREAEEAYLQDSEKNRA